jgi:subtilisin family serine protease
MAGLTVFVRSDLATHCCVACSASLTSPARASRAIAVGAADMIDQRAWFSNFGDAVEMWAPGISIIGKPRFAAMGLWSRMC